MPAKAAAKTGAAKAKGKKVPTVANPLFPSRAHSARVGGDLRVSVRCMMCV